MAIGALYELPGFTQENYEAVVAVVGEEVPRGCYFHIAGPIDEGWRVIEVWESEQAQGAFQRERLDPACDQVGLDRVTPSYFAVHNTEPPPEAMAAMMAGGGGPASS
jgi:hypothetical protein